MGMATARSCAPRLACCRASLVVSPPEVAEPREKPGLCPVMGTGFLSSQPEGSARWPFQTGREEALSLQPEHFHNPRPSEPQLLHQMMMKYILCRVEERCLRQTACGLCCLSGLWCPAKVSDSVAPSLWQVLCHPAAARAQEKPSAGAARPCYQSPETRGGQAVKRRLSYERLRTFLRQRLCLHRQH